MFGLDQQTVKVANVNPRAEKHGDETKLACDLKLEAVLSNGVLEGFDKNLRKALFRKPGVGEQQDLIEGSEGLTAVKFPRMGEVAWDDEYPGYALTIDSALGLLEPLHFEDVTLKKFRFGPLEGGSVSVTCSAIVHPDDSSEAGRLCQLIQSEAVITLTPPSTQLAKAA